MADHLTKILLSIKGFEILQDTYSIYGACDTEPCYVFQNCIARAAMGEEAHIPSDAHGWQLFTNEHRPDPAQAASELSNKALEVVELIGQTTIAESAELKKFLSKYCWRVNF